MMNNNELKYVDTRDLFFCYSLRMFHHLKANGFWYITKEKNPSTNRYYWVFTRTDDLMKALKIYDDEKKKYMTSLDR